MSDETAKSKRLSESSPVSRETTDDERCCFEQVCEMARHYGTMRMAWGSLFTVIVGGLLYAEDQWRPRLEAVRLFTTFRVCCVILAVTFVIAQWRVTALMFFYHVEAARRFLPKLRLPFQTGHEVWRWVAPLVMCLPPGLAGLFWITRLLQDSRFGH